MTEYARADTLQLDPVVSNRSHWCLADRSAAAGVEHVMVDLLPTGKAVQMKGLV